MGYPLGVVDIVFAPLDVPAAAQRAAELGFEHIDVPLGWEGGLALPAGDRIAFPSPRPGGSTPAPPPGDGMWERAVDAFRRAPGSRVEPWAGSIIDSVEAVRAFLAEVPGLRLLVDTGHVACWGGDPVELLPWADHVQLRQARKGEAQTTTGDVDFGAVLRRLDELGYEGRLSIEYFDLPEYGWPLDDPVAHAVTLATEIRALMSRQ